MTAMTEEQKAIKRNKSLANEPIMGRDPKDRYMTCSVCGAKNDTWKYMGCPHCDD